MAGACSSSGTSSGRGSPAKKPKQKAKQKSTGTFVSKPVPPPTKNVKQTLNLHPDGTHAHGKDALPVPGLQALADLVPLMLENRHTQIALIAHVASSSYTPILAGTLADRVHLAFDALEEEGLGNSSRQRQHLSKQQAYAGKLYDPVDLTAELVHHVQWMHRDHASYFTRKTDGATGGPRLACSLEASAAGAPMSTMHLLAQLALSERINADVSVEFLLKCSSSNHLVPVFRTSSGMRARTEVYVPRHGDQRARRLDVAVCEGEKIVFNVEILHSSRTDEGRRAGNWVEANAMHVIEEVQRRERCVRIVCEPRSDQYVHCHFIGRALHRWSCRRCVEHMARARIVAVARRFCIRLMERRAARAELQRLRLAAALAPLVRARVWRRRLAAGVVRVWQARVRERRAVVAALALAFCQKLRRRSEAARGRARNGRAREAAKRKQAKSITGVESKAKMKRGLTERELQRQQQAARVMFAQRTLR